MNSLLLQVKATITEHKLLTKGDRVLVALSGGADSVCLLEALLLLKEELGISVSAAHLHHGLRGEAADEDALFAELEHMRSLLDDESVDLRSIVKRIVPTYQIQK